MITNLMAMTKLALIVLAVLSVCLGAYLGPVFVLLFFAAVKYQGKFKERADYIMNISWAALVMYLTYAMPRCMLHSQYLPDISLPELILNLLCVIIVCTTVYLAIGKLVASVISGSFFLVLLSTANSVIYGLRGKELGPMDFLSVGTAANVAEQYSLSLSLWTIVSLGLWLIAVLLAKGLPKLPKCGFLRSRLYAAATILISVLLITVGIKDKPVKTWETEGTRLNGYYLNFCISMRDLTIQKPDGYTPEQVNDYAQQYIVQDNEGLKPNVIVIMDESYVDFEGAELKTNVSVTPFLDSLTENTIKGHALASVYGGNTANSEFEFLTGHSMAFLPDNTVPYQQYINGSIYSLVWQMRSYGYKTMATHPYIANGWSRPEVYPKLGFSECSFIESYPAKNLVREYISDREMFEYIINCTNGSDEPLFVFGVTMQNHGGYNYKGEDFVNTVELTGYSENYPLAEQYLSLIRETDNALKYLITELEKIRRDTVVLFFGDHFPKLDNGFYEEVYGCSFDTLDEQILQYTVPFFIWSNYDIEEKKVDCTSLSYLSNYLLEAAGLELSSYNLALKDIEKIIPAINATGYYSKAENEFIPVTDAVGEEKFCLDRYSKLQYNNLFDTENRSYNFFERYIIK